MENTENPFQTPKKTSREPLITIPASPFLKKLGYGTGVTVYKFNRSPRSNSTSSPWAVKVATHKKKSSVYNQRLREEADLLRKMNCPYIVGFRQFSKNLAGKECLAMEECTSALSDLIEKRFEEINTAFPANTILKVGLDISKALHYLHDTMKFLHSDIKSHNILVKGDFDVCKLCDFGVSLPLDENGHVDTDLLEVDAEYTGTACWCAPETDGPDLSVITSKADIYSYGLVLWEMIALNIPNSISDTLQDFDLDESNADNFGKRPPVPVHMMEENPESYTKPLQLYYCCTEQDPQYRPTAKHLTLTINEMLTAK